MLRSYLPAVVFLVLGATVGGVFAVINTYIGPRRGPKVKSKADPYECGLPSEVQRGFRFGISFYLIAMLFILFGIEAFRASPRQADLLILSGRISIKMAPVVRRIYDQMLEPRWAIAMGACSSSMGVFNNYAI